MRTGWDKTDCLVFNNVTTDPPTSNAWGGIKKCDVPLIKQCTVNAACGQQNIRTHMYELTHETWHTVEPDNIEQHVDKGYLVIGMAGTGKTTQLNKIKNIGKHEAFRNFITTCPTHKACKLVNGVTIHRMFGINPTDYSYEYKKC